MAAEKNQERRRQIEAAAFEVLEEVGYKKASMLQIAKRAKASNETLYAWYGNKQALFSSLIEGNAQSVRDALEAAIADQPDPGRVLEDVGQLLLQFTATEKAIIVNRAAVTDTQETGLLAQAIETGARQVMIELLGKLFGRMAASGKYHFPEGPGPATADFIGLLIGELQLQQALGAEPPLSAQDISRRSARACAQFDRLYQAA